MTSVRRLLAFVAAVCLAVVCLFAVDTDASAASADEPQHVYEMPFKGGRQIERLNLAGYDVLGVEDGVVRVVGGPSDEAFFASLGVTPKIARQASPFVRERAYGPDLDGYHTYAEMEAALQSLASTYPTLCELSVMGTSVEGRNLYVLKISDNASLDEAEPEVLIMGNLHAREVMSVEIPLKFAEYLLNEYATNPQVQALVDAREVFIAPMMNPDGHVYVENNNASDWWTWWRKNRRNNGDGTIGVDLNRNFGFHWGLDNIGSSPNPASGVYRGPSAFSEPETQAIRDFCAARNFTVSFSYHSYSELLLYPWGYAYDYTADHELFHALGQDLTSTNGYFAGNPAEGAIYLTNGDSDDWFYGNSTVKNSFLGFTPELNSAAEGGFGPPDTLIQPTFDLMLPMNLRLLELADEPRKVLGPLVPVMQASSFAAPTLTLNWSANDPLDVNPVASYEVEQFIDLGHDALDDASVLDAYFEPGGWTLSSNAASGPTSYYSGSGDNLQRYLTSKNPYEVTAATQNLTCMLNYDIELDYDYAYLEVSDDGGLIWQTVPGSETTNADPNAANRGNGITGNSGGWVTATFDLSAFLGQTVDLRFVYSTDGSVQGNGIRIDDIAPVARSSSRSIVASGVTAPSLDLPVTQIARYSHRVRAYDAEGDVSRWSNLVSDQLDPITATVLPSHVWSAVHANVPNPFNPRTVIPFTIGGVQGERVFDLAVYDVAGRRVRVLQSGVLPVGTHRAVWDGADDHGSPVASGVYLVQLNVEGEGVVGRKVTLLK